MQVSKLTKSSNLFDDQYVTYSVFKDENSPYYCVRMHFEDYCEVVLKNTTGLRWTFLNEELAWAFVHSDYVINLHYILKGVRKSLYRNIGVSGDQIARAKSQDLFIRLANYLGVIKFVKTAINRDGEVYEINHEAQITFFAEIIHSAQNFGSYEFQFELKKIQDDTLVLNFTSNEVGKIFDINEEIDNIVYGLDSSDYINLIKNQIKTINVFPLQEFEFQKLKNLNRFLEFLGQ
jgi:hypothetical protein